MRRFDPFAISLRSNPGREGFLYILVYIGCISWRQMKARADDLFYMYYYVSQGRAAAEYIFITFLCVPSPPQPSRRAGRRQQHPFISIKIHSEKNSAVICCPLLHYCGM